MTIFAKSWRALKAMGALDDGDDRCLECGGIIPMDPSGGPYDVSNLCDCESPFPTIEEWDEDREPKGNTWHPDPKFTFRQ